MLLHQKFRSGKKNIGITITQVVMVMLVLFSSCSGSKKNLGEAITERDSMSVMTTIGVITLVSDSGVVRYRIKAEEWMVFDRRKPPYWAFEKGLHLEKFDTLMNIEATIKCDTAYYFNEMRLWKLIGNINMTNPKHQRFYTDLLYWDQEEKIIYSDAYIRVEQEDQITEGVGFSSNQDLSVWQIRNTKGIYTVDK